MVWHGRLIWHNGLSMMSIRDGVSLKTPRPRGGVAIPSDGRTKQEIPSVAKS